MSLERKGYYVQTGLVLGAVVLGFAVGYLVGVDSPKPDTAIEPNRVHVTTPDRKNYSLTVRPEVPGAKPKALDEQPADAWIITLFQDPPANAREPMDTKSKTYVAVP